MPHKTRETSILDAYHVGLKGNRSQVIFFDDADRLNFLKALFCASEEFSVGIAAWALMSNHVHLLLHGSLSGISSLVQSISASYVQVFNMRSCQEGKLWKGRYHSVPINTSEEYSQVAAYIFNNPVYAGIISDTREYEWSNFNEICLGYDEDAIKLINSITDVNQIINLTKINAQKKLSREMKERLEVFPKARVPDDILISAVKGTLSTEELIQAYVLPEEQQRCIVDLLLNNGASINQVSRITGISRRWIVAFTED